MLGREAIKAMPPHMMQEFLSPQHMLFSSMRLLAAFEVFPEVVFIAGRVTWLVVPALKC
jgi:hypothetical protein